MKHMSKLTLIPVVLFAFSTISQAAPKENPGLIAKGKAAYLQNCLMCHGDKGDGKGPAGAAFKPPVRNFMTDAFKGVDGKGNIKDPNVQQVFDVISKGVKGTAMAAFGHIKEEDRWGVAYYVLQLRKTK